MMMKPRSLASVWAPLLMSVRVLLVNASSSASSNSSSFSVPEALCSPFGAYPNVLGISEEDRQSFHPVVKLPSIWSDEEATTAASFGDNNDSSTTTSNRRVLVPHVAVPDFSKPSDRIHLASPEQIRQKQEDLDNMPGWRRRLRLMVPSMRLLLSRLRKEQGPRHFGIGRYDEDRIGMYTSEMFEDLENSIDGYAGARTVHVGIDLGGPVGGKVYAFADGYVHSAGYNADLGDYGYVVVIEHTIPSNGNKVWALYGHLDQGSVQGRHPGQEIKKGQIVGRFGDINENGGWFDAHVHFQLATEPPKTHDMPGAVAKQDRPKALLQYPDPRWVLGPLY